jgi:hypothetical protein
LCIYAVKAGPGKLQEWYTTKPLIISHVLSYNSLQREGLRLRLYRKSLQPNDLATLGVHTNNEIFRPRPINFHAEEPDVFSARLLHRVNDLLVLSLGVEILLADARCVLADQTAEFL